MNVFDQKADFSGFFNTSGCTELSRPYVPDFIAPGLTSWKRHGMELEGLHSEMDVPGGFHRPDLRLAGFFVTTAACEK